MKDHRHEHGGRACREMFAKLSEYLDGEIDPEGCAHFEDHLDGCAPCRDFLESLRRTVKLVQADPEAGLPDDVKREVVEAWRRARRELLG